MKSRNLLLGAATAAWLVSVGSAAHAQSGETIKIALIDPMSGPMANIGEAFSKVYQIEAERLSGKGNAAGVNKLGPSFYAPLVAGIKPHRDRLRSDKQFVRWLPRSRQINRVTSNLARTSEKPQCYWQQYPHFIHVISWSLFRRSLRNRCCSRIPL